MTVSQRERSKFEQRSIIKIIVGWKVQICKEMCDVYEEASFYQKKKLRDEVEETVYEVETRWLSGKEKVLGAAVRKEGHANSLLGHKRSITIDFLEKSATL